MRPRVRQVKIDGVYADYEILARLVAPPDLDQSGDIWLELCVRHAVTGEVIFQRQGAYVCADGGAISPKQALYSAVRQAERILARKLDRAANKRS